jgi:hypothetical protein
MNEPYLGLLIGAVTELGWDDGIRALSAEPESLTLRIRCNIPTADGLVSRVRSHRSPVYRKVVAEE